MSALVTVEGLTVTIGDVAAVRGISFEVARGETLALVGESGSGKSMTALAMMGLTPPTAQLSGQIAMADGSHPSERRGDRVAMVFQEPMTALNPVFTIGDQLMAVYRRHKGGSEAEARQRAVTLLTRVGVPEPEARLKHYPHMMSGGQRQRVLIAMALMCGPDLLIADEPTTALDVTTQARLLDLLKGLGEEFGLGMLFITHDLGVVAKIGDRVAVMKDGEIVETGSARAVLAAPKHTYTQRLIDSLPTPHGCSAPTTELILRAEGIGRIYGARTVFGGEPFRALKGVSLALGRGEALGIVGESGCGKSTLARIVIGLDSPSEGRVEIDGIDAATIPQRARAKLIQPVFQDPFGSLNPACRVKSILNVPLSLHTRLSGPQRAQRIAELLDDVGLPERVATATPRALSGGQRQRVAIARALAAEPRILVCDEPTSALDVSVQAQVLDLLRRLRQEKDLSMIFISHDLAVVEAICDRVMVMDAGEIVEEGTADAIFNAPRHAATRALKEAVLTLDGLTADT